MGNVPVQSYVYVKLAYQHVAKGKKLQGNFAMEYFMNFAHMEKLECIFAVFISCSASPSLSMLPICANLVGSNEVGLIS